MTLQNIIFTTVKLQGKKHEENQKGHNSIKFYMMFDSHSEWANNFESILCWNM